MITADVSMRLNRKEKGQMERKEMDSSKKKRSNLQTFFFHLLSRSLLWSLLVSLSKSFYPYFSSPTSALSPSLLPFLAPHPLILHLPPISFRLCVPCHCVWCPRLRHMALFSLLLSSINTVVVGITDAQDDMLACTPATDDRRRSQICCLSNTRKIP